MTRLIKNICVQEKDLSISKACSKKLPTTLQNLFSKHPEVTAMIESLSMGAFASAWFSYLREDDSKKQTIISNVFYLLIEKYPKEYQSILKQNLNANDKEYTRLNIYKGMQTIAMSNTNMDMRH